MTKQHRATPEQWEFIELYADSLDADACILELRARIEALEAAQPHQDKLDRLIAIDRDDPAEDAAQQPLLFTAALAQAGPGAPTDEEIEEWADASSEVPLEEMDPDIHGWRRCFTKEQFGASIREALACWGTPAIQPVPVSERPWEREGWCDAEGRCYGWDGDYWWMVGNPGSANETITHWLPHWALPVPTPANNTREETN
jgi:hypothetical protein